MYLILYVQTLPRHVVHVGAMKSNFSAISLTTQQDVLSTDFWLAVRRIGTCELYIVLFAANVIGI